LTLTSPTSGGRSVGIVRSRTQATEFVCSSSSSSSNSINSVIVVKVVVIVIVVTVVVVVVVAVVGISISSYSYCSNDSISSCSSRLVVSAAISHHHHHHYFRYYCFPSSCSTLFIFICIPEILYNKNKRSPSTDTCTKMNIQYVRKGTKSNETGAVAITSIIIRISFCTIWSALCLKYKIQ
jgi:hypothetical protein